MSFSIVTLNQVPVESWILIATDAACAGFHNELYRYSTQEGWEVLAQDAMPGARARHKISVLGGKIYLFGGYAVSGA